MKKPKKSSSKKSCLSLRAQRRLKRRGEAISWRKIDNSWALFLDRDGVVNKMVVGDYVCKWSDFKFLPSFLKNIKKLSRIFGRIFIVTNQRCVSRGLLTKAKLEAIHKRMLREIKKAGGRIDKIYYCPHGNSDGCKCRKPRPGMAQRAKKDFKGVDLKRSVMVGDSDSDMEFAVNAGIAFFCWDMGLLCRALSEANICHCEEP